MTDAYTLPLRYACPDCGEATDECTCDLYPPECHCGLPRCEDELTCSACRADARALVPVVMAALDELYWRRVNHETLGGSRPLAYIQRTVVVAEPEETTPVRAASAPGSSSLAPSIYDLVSPGSIAALGLALGSLSVLVRGVL